MVETDRGHLLVALVLGLAGMLLGFYMGIAADNKLQTVHVAMVLPGFVTLAIYGFDRKPRLTARGNPPSRRAALPSDRSALRSR
jgi:hypothetical protein